MGFSRYWAHNHLICAVLPCRGFHNRTTVGKQTQQGKEILFALDPFCSLGGWVVVGGPRQFHPRPGVELARTPGPLCQDRNSTIFDHLPDSRTQMKGTKSARSQRNRARLEKKSVGDALVHAAIAYVAHLFKFVH